MSAILKSVTLAVTSYPAASAPTVDLGFPCKSILITNGGAIPIRVSFDGGANDQGRVEFGAPKEWSQRVQLVWLKLESGGSQTVYVEGES